MNAQNAAEKALRKQAQQELEAEVKKELRRIKRFVREAEKRGYTFSENVIFFHIFWELYTCAKVTEENAGSSLQKGQLYIANRQENQRHNKKSAGTQRSS